MAREGDRGAGPYNIGIGRPRGDIGLRVDAEQVADAEPHDLIRHQEENGGRMTITNTIMVVTVVSLRVGQVTFCASARTSCRNLNGSICTIACLTKYSLPTYPVGLTLRIRRRIVINFAQAFRASD